MPYRLRITGPNDTVQEVPLDSTETRIGRAPDCEIVLPGRGVSRQHAVISREGDAVILKDLGSRYGTRVRGEPVQAQELRPGDTFGVGVFKVQLIFAGGDKQTRPGPIPPLVQFTAGDLEKGVHAVLHRHQSNILGAVERLAKDVDKGALALRAAPQPADYRALLLMTRVSAVVARSRDLGEFLEQISDLCADELGAETIVILKGATTADLTPLCVRHRAQLQPGEIPVSRTLLETALGERSTVVLADAEQQPGDSSPNAPLDRPREQPSIKSASVRLYHVRAAVATPLLVGGRTLGLLYAARSSGPFDMPAADLFTGLATLVGSALERQELNDRLRSEEDRRRALERFHSPEVASELARAASDEEPALKEIEATVLAMDLFGYAGLVDRLSPRALAAFLAAHYQLLYDVAFAHRGTLVKVWGGRALLMFGPPTPSSDDAKRACKAALALRDSFTAVSKQHAPSAKLQPRLAMDTGPVLAGHIGPAERLEYSALGECVTVALDLAARGPDRLVLLSERTHAKLKEKSARVRTVDRAYGSDELSVYELVELR